MTTKNTTAADKVFKMLGFQYQPLEKKFLEFCKKEKGEFTGIAKQYGTANGTQKIKVLDNFANFIGL